MFHLFILREREREREREWASKQGRSRERIPSQHNTGLEPTNCEIMTWAETSSRPLNRLSHPSDLFTFNVYLFLRERDREREGEGQRQRETHRIWSRLQAPRWQHRARCRARTQEPRGHNLSWSWTLNRLSHLGTPDLFTFKTFIQIFWFSFKQDQ